MFHSIKNLTRESIPWSNSSLFQTVSKIKARRLSLVPWACIELSTTVHWHINVNLEVLGQLGTGDSFLGTSTRAWLSSAWGLWFGETGCRFLRHPPGPTGCWLISDTMKVSNLIRWRNYPEFRYIRKVWHRIWLRQGNWCIGEVIFFI